MTGLSAVDRGQTDFPLVAAFSKVHSTAQAGPIRFLKQLAAVPVPMAATTVEDEEVSIPSRHWHRSRASLVELALGTLLHRIYRSSLIEMFRESTYISSNGMGGALVYNWKTS